MGAPTAPPTKEKRKLVLGLVKVLAGAFVLTCDRNLSPASAAPPPNRGDDGALCDPAPPSTPPPAPAPPPFAAAAPRSRNLETAVFAGPVDAEAAAAPIPILRFLGRPPAAAACAAPPLLLPFAVADDRPDAEFVEVATVAVVLAAGSPPPPSWDFAGDEAALLKSAAAEDGEGEVYAAASAAASDPYEADATADFLKTNR